MSSTQPVEPLVDVEKIFPQAAYLRACRPWIRRMENFLGITALNRVHEEASALCREEGISFWKACVRVMDLRLQIASADMMRIPATGPVVVVANHPFGATEAILLMDLLESIRPDVRVLGNGLLLRMPEVAKSVIGVEVDPGEKTIQRNARAARAALQWLRQQGMLLVFPSGTVSHLNLASMTVTDPVWSTAPVGLAGKTGAMVLPIFVPGRNRWSFQIAGLFHARFRTGLLAREMAAQLGSTVRCFVGKPLAAARLLRGGDAREATDFLRIQTYALQGRAESPGAATRVREGMAPLAPAVDPQMIREEIARLPVRCSLVREGNWEVFAVTTPQIPSSKRELARLREHTFRAAGEGTGQPSDWDGYDEHYLHLLLWDRAQGQIAGGYRMGRADWILDEYGVRGLYTRSLFHYGSGFIRSLGHALELGRSFVCPEYQRHALPLSLLWRGIGTWLVRHPRYHTLFGPVSISQDYQQISRNLMVQFLRGHAGAHGRPPRVRAPHPHRMTWMPGLGLDPAGARLADIEDVSTVVASIEDDGKGVPVLLRHYLKLKARLLTFNRDPEFSNVLDGLVVVDLRQSDPRLLQRFMGVEGWRAHARFHQIEVTVPE
jgi:putative hemolysin